MLAAQRQAGIASVLRDAGAVSVSELASRFEVSEMTIRRDLDSLVAEGAIAKVHGGAISLDADSAHARRTEEPGFPAKSSQMRAEKRGIAAAAAALIQPGMSIGLSAGTTTWALAQQLLGIPDLTIVTNSTRIADIFQDASRTGSEGRRETGTGRARASDQTVILTGGVRTPSDALVGPIANRTLQPLHLDLVCFGAHGVSVDAGFTTPNLEECETNRALLKTAASALVLADHSKWNTTALGTFAELAGVDTLITDTGLAERAADDLRERLDRLILADPIHARRTP